MRALLLATSLCTTPQPPLVTDTQVHQPPELSEPAARVPFRDPVFGSCVARVTDRTKDIDTSDTSRGLKNEYSRAQAFNADDSRLLIRGTNATWYLYDARTLAPLGILPFAGSVDPRWDATDRNVLYYVEEATPRLYRFSVTTRQSTLQHDFAADFPGIGLYDVTTGHDGNPTVDGKTWGFLARGTDYRTVAYLLYDLPSDRVVAKRDVRSIPLAAGAESGMVSPLGSYFVVHFDYCERGTLGTDAQPCGLMVYDRSLQNGRGLIRIFGHADLALDAAGREVMVFQDVDTDDLAMLDLNTGAWTALWPIDFCCTSISFHLSGRATSRPGWAVVSTVDTDKESHTWMDDQAFVMELKARGRILRAAHGHSLVDDTIEHDYWAEPHATANRDLTKILFTTNGNKKGSEEVETYMVEVPASFWGATTTHTSQLPAVAHSPGQLGSLWRSDVAVVNRGSGEASVTLTYAPVEGSPGTRDAKVAAGATFEWGDVLASLFGYASDAATSGSLLLTSTQPLVVSSRTFNQGASGTYGGFLAGVSTGLAPGKTGYLPLVRRTPAYRTNVGISNLGTASAIAIVKLWSSSGARLGSDVRVPVAGGALVQVNDLFGAAGASDTAVAYATVEVETPGGLVAAYASVIDNVTGDPTIVPLETPGSIP